MWSGVPQEPGQQWSQLQHDPKKCPHHVPTQLLPTNIPPSLFAFLFSLFCTSMKWIRSLGHPYFMSSSLAKITMALALGVSRSCLIILSKSIVLSLRSWGIFRDWAMQSPPVEERREGLSQWRTQERQWRHTERGAWKEEKLSDCCLHVEFNLHIRYPVVFLPFGVIWVGHRPVP